MSVLNHQENALNAVIPCNQEDTHQLVPVIRNQKNALLVLKVAGNEATTKPTAVKIKPRNAPNVDLGGATKRLAANTKIILKTKSRIGFTLNYYLKGE